jgi:hypothetical protein
MRKIVVVRRQQETVTRQKAKGNYHLYIPVPARNCYRVTSEPSCGNELFPALMEACRRPKTLQENILQVGKTSVVRPPTSSCRAGAVRGTNFFDK